MGARTIISVVYRAAGAGLGRLACCTPCARLADSMRSPGLFR